MPTKEEQDTRLWAGRDYTINFTETNSEDLSGFNEVTYAFAAHERASAEFTKNTTSGITIPSSSNDTAQVSISGSDTGSLSVPGQYYHELITEDGSGNEQQAATGEVVLLPTVFDN